MPKLWASCSDHKQLWYKPSYGISSVDDEVTCHTSLATTFLYTSADIPKKTLQL